MGWDRSESDITREDKGNFRRETFMGPSYFSRSDREIDFLLFEHLELERLLNYPAFGSFSLQSFKELIREGLEFASRDLGPTLQDGDRQGCLYEDGRVTVPESFHDCWRAFQDKGFVSLSTNPAWGGLGLPMSVAGVLTEIFFGGNLALAIFAMLASGNARLIELFGTDQDRELFVRKMNTGLWGGTMCLSEPESGSDVGWLKTKAVPDPDSDDPRLFLIQGRKRFITCGEHDLTENIIHLVLARIQGAERGTKGVSLFIVPKIRVNPDGSLGTENDVFCRRIERKMGLHGSPTCRLDFGLKGRCQGILLGEPQTGMAKMFKMMNEARLATGLMGLGTASAAYDKALDYAKVRRQGPPFTDRRSERVPLIQHEDVRRMLMNLKAGTEAMRAMVGWVYLLQDRARHDPDPEIRDQSRLRLDLFTPVVKASCTDYGYDLIRDAIQILGGTGYCSDFPVEQYARDCKVTSIWEGTSYIQSLDLVGRKLPLAGGAVFRDWLTEVISWAGAKAEDPDLGEEAKMLCRTAEALGAMALGYAQWAGSDKVRLIPLTSTRFLKSMAEVLMGRLILEQGFIARDKTPSAGEGDGPFYQGKTAAARYFCGNVLPRVLTRQRIISAGDTSALDIPEKGF